MTEEFVVRHSKAEDAKLVEGEEAVARREAANALVQTEFVRNSVLAAIDGSRQFRLRPSVLLALNKCAIDGLSAYAGNWRPGAVKIEDSKHAPPEAGVVPALAEELCDYVVDNWDRASAVHLAAFVMWRLNWIHPFADGNGRTSRAASYLVLCCKLNSWLPGEKTIPDQITSYRKPYYDALEAADSRYAKNSSEFTPDIVLEMEVLLGGMLASQLLSAVEAAK